MQRVYSSGMMILRHSRRLFPALPLLTVLLALQTPAVWALSVADAVRAAFDTNPTLWAAAHRVAAAQSASDAAQAAWYPRLRVSAGYERTDNPPQAFMMQLNQGRLDMRDPAFDPNRPRNTGNANLTAGLHYLLYDGGARRVRADLAADATRQMALHQQAVRNALAFEVVQAWYGLLHACAMLEVQDDTLQSLESLLSAARERFAAGTAVRTDVLNLEVRLAEAREQQIQLRHARLLALEALHAAVGRELLSPEALPSAPAVDLPDPPPDPGPAAYRQRPEWQAARLAWENADEAVRLARRDGRPRLKVFAASSLDGETLDDGRHSYRAGVVAEWEAFTGFERSAAIRRAVADSLAVEAELEALSNRLHFELRQAFLGLVEAQERIEVADQSAAGAAESLRITRERYAGGAVAISELLLAQVADTAARMRQVAARYDYCVAVANLQRATGGLDKRFDRASPGVADGGGSGLEPPGSACSGCKDGRKEAQGAAGESAAG